MTDEPLTESRRAVQASLLPDVPDRPIGRIVGSVQTGTNGDLIAAIAPLYLTGSVCDVTYGEGGWWRRFTPDPFIAHDLDPNKGDGVDFTALPEPDNTYDAVAFDPPYIPQGGTNHAPQHDRGRKVSYRGRFGLVSRSDAEVAQLMAGGLAECARVSRRWVLVKCMDYASSKELYLGHVKAIELGSTLGLRCHDLIVHHKGPGPGGYNIFTPLRARRHHSYLLVFRKSSNGS